jgi:hypothetical protein
MMFYVTRSPKLLSYSLHGLLCYKLFVCTENPSGITLESEAR